MAEDTEVAMEKSPKAETMPDTGIEEEHKLEVRVNETESSMLEDETMPTFLSITSNVSSLKPDNSNNEPDIHETATDDEEIRSIYEVSSDDDRQENSRVGYSNRHANLHDDNDDEDNEDEEDEDDYEDSEDSRMNGRTRPTRYGDESDEIDNDEEDCVEEEEEEDSDGDIEPEQFERSSDDFVLRNSSSSLEKLHRERSRSLQDLSPKKSLKFYNKRQVAIHTDQYGENSYPINYNDSKQSSLFQSKYSHVPSKVKLYIKGIKEQSRQSELRKSSIKVDSDAYMVDIDQQSLNRETDNMILNPQCRRLKTFTEYSMGVMMEEATPHNPLVTSIDNNHQITLITNGDKIVSAVKMKEYEQADAIHDTMEIDDGSQDHDQCGKQLNKPNGKIDYSVGATEFEHLQKSDSVIQSEPPINRQDGIVGTIVNIETLTYEDYMKVNTTDIYKFDAVSNKDTVKSVDVGEVIVDAINLPSNRVSIQTEDSVHEEPLVQNGSDNKMICNEEPQTESVKSPINKNLIEEQQKTNDYQKILHENLELKREIEKLKKVLAIHNNDMKRKEMKIVAVQTENPPKIIKHTSTSTHLQLPNKLSTSITSETGSTISSIEQWTDSEYSPTISLKPPNIEYLLNSNDGTSQANSKTSSQSASRALWTTNRILQTLANMTPGRPVSSMVDTKFDGQGQSKDTISPVITGGKFSRKRKASDNLETSAFGPLSSKIPSLNTIDARKKLNSTSDTDGAIKVGLSSGFAAAANGAHQRDNTKNEQEFHGHEETDDDDVKCFVWHENENTQERSCLIQAPIGHEEFSKTGETKKHIRECGPYLLGNLEVRISEANGTLNIWGKEISQKSQSQESESVEEEQNETFNDSENLWPKTPRTIVDNNFKCSTTKKMKTPTTIRANISRHMRVIRTPSPTSAQIANHLDDMPNLFQRGTTNCNQCHSHKRFFSPMCSHHPNAQMKQSCCSYKAESNFHDCNCRREHEPIIENFYCSCIAQQHACLSSNYKCHCENLRQHHTCVNHLSAEAMCKHTATCHRLSDSEPEDCRHIPKRRCNSGEVNNCNPSVENVCFHETNSRQREVNACNNHYLSEEIDSGMNSEQIRGVSRKCQRHCGKRARNIMEFFKGCGDCRNPETSSIDSCRIPEKETTNTRSIPSTRLISDTPSTPSYPKQLNNPKIQKECNSCLKYAEQAAELEAELKIVRMEISKLHSRSNVMRDMLHRVLQADLDSAT